MTLYPVRHPATKVVSSIRRRAFASLLCLAFEQVVERLRPSYRLIISAKVAASALLRTEGKWAHDDNSGDNEINLASVSQTWEGAANVAAQHDNCGCGEAEVVASLSLGKSEIKGALERCGGCICCACCRVDRNTRRTNRWGRGDFQLSSTQDIGGSSC